MISVSDLKRPNAKLARWLLQIGLATVFIYAAVASLRQPADWTTFLPNWLPSWLAPLTALKILAVYELVLAAWLLTGRWLRLAAWLSAATFAAIILVNWHFMLITFRDVGLLFAALALAFWPE